jgi:hypothetical protein
MGQGQTLADYQLQRERRLRPLSPLTFANASPGGKDPKSAAFVMICTPCA